MTKTIERDDLIIASFELTRELQQYKDKEQELRELVERYKDEYVPNDYILEVLNKIKEVK